MLHNSREYARAGWLRRRQVRYRMRISVLNGAYSNLKVKCSISKTITDEI